jgi:hypothetical protein
MSSYTFQGGDTPPSNQLCLRSRNHVGPLPMRLIMTPDPADHQENHSLQPYCPCPLARLSGNPLVSRAPLANTPNSLDAANTWNKASPRRKPTSGVIQIARAVTDGNSLARCGKRGTTRRRMVETSSIDPESTIAYSHAGCFCRSLRY